MSKYPTDEDVQEAGQLGYETGLQLGRKAGSQACYEIMRAGNCCYGAWHEEVDYVCVYTISDDDSCAKNYKDCPLHRRGEL